MDKKLVVCHDCLLDFIQTKPNGREIGLEVALTVENANVLKSVAPAVYVLGLGLRQSLHGGELFGWAPSYVVGRWKNQPSEVATVCVCIGSGDELAECGTAETSSPEELLFFLIVAELIESLKVVVLVLVGLSPKMKSWVQAWICRVVAMMASQGSMAWGSLGNSSREVVIVGMGVRTPASTAIYRVSQRTRRLGRELQYHATTPRTRDIDRWLRRISHLSVVFRTHHV